MQVLSGYYGQDMVIYYVLIWIPLRKNYKKNFNVSSDQAFVGKLISSPNEGPSLKTSTFNLYFSGS